MQVRFGILGPLEATAAGRRLELGGPRPRRLLAMLLVHAGQVVSTDRLIEGVWDGHPPARAEVTLRAHVAKLRRRLHAGGAGDVVTTRSPGYVLVAAPEQLDAARFEQLAEQGRGALGRGDATRAAAMLRAALGLWRGRVLEDLDGPRSVEAEAARLDELRLAALEARVDADLALGRHGEVTGELEAAVAAHPFRERLCGQLMLALYRSGRQADALEVYRAVRERLGDELGLAPGPALDELQTAILRQDRSLVLAGGGPPPAAAPPGGPPGPAAPADALLDVVRRVPMVGRARELDRLRTLWHAVREGGRRVALLSGEAGVGKTRLAAELAGLASEDGAIVLVGRCERDGLVPYQPVAEALRGNPDAWEAFAGAPGSLRSLLAPLLDPGTAATSRDGSWSESPGRRQAAFFDAVGRLVARMTAVAPVVFVVEEAEGIDRASAHLLRHLAQRLPERVLLLVAFRDPPGSRHPPLRELLAAAEGRSLADRLGLHPLPEQDLAALVASWAGTDAPASFVHALWASTGGNPFFAGEVVRDLVARGGIERADDAWGVPAGVRDVLRERLHALPQATQDIVAGAATLGRVVDFGLLAKVADRPADQAARGLEDAVQAGLLVEAGRSGDARYAFRHALMREAVHVDIPALQRQRLHLRAADVLEGAGLRRPGDVAVAAAHLRRAGSLADPERAAALSLRAADEAAGVYAWDEAVAHAEAAVTVLADAGAPPGRQAEAAMRAAELLEKSSLDYERAIEYLQAALEHHRAAGDPAAVATVHSRLGYVLSVHHRVMDIPRALEHFTAAEKVLPDGDAAFGVHFGKATAAGFGLRTDDGADAAQRALDLAQRSGRPEQLGWARAAQACFPFYRGELAAARGLRHAAWAAAQDLGDPHLGWDTAVCSAAFDGMYLLDPPSAQRWCRRASTQPRLETIVSAIDAVRDQHVHALASMGRLAAARDAAARLPADAVSRRLLLLLDGDWEAAERSWAEALEHDLDNGDLLNATLNAGWLGRARWLLGRSAGAVTALRLGLTISLEAPHVPAELMIRADLARVLAAGDVEEAADHLAHCDKILADGQDWRGRVGAVELARGALAGAHGQVGLLDAAHAAALEVFALYRLPWWRAETLTAWAGWLDAAGRPGAAAVKRRAGCQGYEELGASERWRWPVADGPGDVGSPPPGVTAGSDR